MEPEVIGVAEVAAILGHAAPTSRAAAEKVRRLVARGLPVVPHCRPQRFLRTQVLEWLALQAYQSAIATPAALTQPRSRRTPVVPAKGAAGKAAGGRRPVDAFVAELKGKSR